MKKMLMFLFVLLPLTVLPVCFSFAEINEGAIDRSTKEVDTDFRKIAEKHLELFPRSGPVRIDYLTDEEAEEAERKKERGEEAEEVTSGGEEISGSLTSSAPINLKDNESPTVP